MAHPSNSEVGIVYVIRDEASWLHKIGITLDWQRRSRQLDIGTKTRAICIVRTIRPGEIERELHLRYKAFRLPQSEWFNLQSHHIAEIKQVLIVAREEFKAALDFNPSPRAPKPYSYSKFRNNEALHDQRIEIFDPASSSSGENDKSSYESTEKDLSKNKQANMKSWNASSSKTNGSGVQSSCNPSSKNSSSHQTPTLALFIGCLAIGYYAGGGNMVIVISLAVLAVFLLMP